MWSGPRRWATTPRQPTSTREIRRWPWTGRAISTSTENCAAAPRFSAQYSLTSQGNTDQYVAKLSAADGAVLWATHLGTTDTIWKGQVAADATGVYTCGLFNAAIPNFGLTNSGVASARDSFVIKFDGNTGATAWVKQFVDQTLDQGSGSIAADGESLYVAAGLSSQGVATNGLVARYAPNGDTVWSRPWGTNDFTNDGNKVRDICFRGDSVYLVGCFSTPFTPLDFDLSPNSQYLLTGRVGDMFLWKIGKNSAFGWVEKIARSPYVPPPSASLTIDPSGNLVIVGNVPATHDSFIDYDPGPGVAPLKTEFDTDAYVMKLDPNGDYMWAFQIGQFNVIADNGESTYSEIGSGWADGVVKSGKTSSGTGWGGDSRIPLAGTGANKAQWRSLAWPRAPTRSMPRGRPT